MPLDPLLRRPDLLGSTKLLRRLRSRAHELDQHDLRDGRLPNLAPIPDYLWEQKLRYPPCNYKGDLPYWNWFKHHTEFNKSPVFGGSDTSLGGDGAFVAHDGSVVGAGRIWFPFGAGGGCVKSGAFVHFTINIGPVQPKIQGYIPVYTDIKSYNLRYQRRDLMIAASTSTFTALNLFNITFGEALATVGYFQDKLQGPLGRLYLHGPWHYTMGGDRSDVFTSLNSPAFYLHHAIIDRLYWI